MLSAAGLAVFRNLNNARDAEGRLCTESVGVSPVSIGLALSMIRAGASKCEHGGAEKGSATLEQILRLLGHDKIRNEDELDTLLAELVAKFDGNGVFVANSLWVDSSIKEEFVEKCKSVFSAGVHRLAPKEEINAYVEKKTGGHITDLLKADPTGNLLLNTVYLKFTWFVEFDPRDSVAGATFHGFSGEVPCRMMNRKKSALNVCKVGSSTVVLLPYANGLEKDEDDDDVFRFCAVFVLPRETGASALVDALDNVFGDVEAAIKSAMHHTTLVELSLPAFNVRTGTKPLRPVLEALGMRRAFQKEEAELDRMALGSAWVDEVLHSVVIEVDEAGTVATAATAVATTKGPSRPVTKVYINRPFGFSVFDLHTRDTLFAASVVNP
jgi:serpin B